MTMGAGSGGDLKGDQQNVTSIAGSEPGLRATLALAAAFVAIWTAYFTITNAPMAIHHDMAEAYVWGREFQLGYNQHPPFWAWVCGVWFSVLPRTGWAFALLSCLNAGIGLIGAWMLLGNFVTGHRRIAATALLLLTPFYTFLSYRYNANSIFLSIWPWTLYFFVRSIERRGIGDALLFGVCIGLGLMSKYYALILGASCFLAALQHPARASYFASVRPYISAIVAAAICAPHIWWLLSSGAPPVRYLAQISGRDFGSTARYAAIALFGAVAQNAVVFAVVAFVGRTGPRDWIASLRQLWREPKFRLLTTLALAPLALTIVAAIVLRTKISTNMTIGVFSLVPLLAIEIAGVRDDARLSHIATRLAAALTLISLALSPAIALVKASLTTDGAAIQPRQELADAATRLWREKTSRPLSYVAGSFAYDNAVAFYSADRPHSFERFDFFRNRWVTPADIAEFGLLAVCVRDDAECLASTARFGTPQSTRTEMSLAHAFLGHVGAPVRFVVTVIPPRDPSDLKPTR